PQRRRPDRWNARARAAAHSRVVVLDIVVLIVEVFVLEILVVLGFVVGGSAGTVALHAQQAAQILGCAQGVVPFEHDVRFGKARQALSRPLERGAPHAATGTQRLDATVGDRTFGQVIARWVAR